MRTVYLSPHLDDAILSAGGLIFDQIRAGMDVEIWTFMCGFPGTEAEELTDFARFMHVIWGTNSAEETIRIRREEDRRAASVVGAKAVHFDFLDCLYRRGREGEALYPDGVFVPPNPQDADLPAQVAQTIILSLRSGDSVVCPLGIGEHVDHVLVRQAAEMSIRLSPTLGPLAYDADIPYFLNHPDQLAPKIAGMPDEVHPISEAGLGSWLAAIEAYASQQSSLFETPDSMRERMRAYWSRDLGIRLWTAQPGISGRSSPENGKNETTRPGLDSGLNP